MTIKIYVLHTGKVCVSPCITYGGAGTGLVKASGIFTRKKDRIWLPVSAYLIEHPKGLLLFDTGWHRDMSPRGGLDREAQIRHLGRMLYKVNQGYIALGETVDEQIAGMGLKVSDIDHVILSHLDCDHVSGIKLVKDAKNIIVSNYEIEFSKKHRVRYNEKMWNGVELRGFDFEDSDVGPSGSSYDLFGDSSVLLVSIPGHSDGQCAMKISNEDGKFVLLFADGGYSRRSWDELILPGIASDRLKQKRSLEWIREQSLDSNCVESIANHDPDVSPHCIIL